MINLINATDAKQINIGTAKFFTSFQFFLQKIYVPGGNKAHTTPHLKLLLNAKESILKNNIIDIKKQAI